MTITPGLGTSGTARTASRNRRRRPQAPGEPRHAANTPGFEETPPAGRRPSDPGRHSGEGPGDLFPGDLDEVRTDAAEESYLDPAFPAPAQTAPAAGLGAQLYEVMSESERQNAVAETLLFVRPDFDQELPAATAGELPADPAPGAGTRPGRTGGSRFGRATVAQAGRAADERSGPGRRDVSPLTETFLFGPPVPPVPPAQHAQQPRSPIDGAAETLLFAGLARALATQPEPADAGNATVPAGTGSATAAPADEPGPAADHSVTWDTIPPVEDGADRAGGTEIPAGAVDWARSVETPADSVDWGGGAEAPAGPVDRGGGTEAPAAPVDWDVDDPGWAEPAYPLTDHTGHRIPQDRRRAWEEWNRNAAQPLPDTGGDREPRRGRGRETSPEVLEMGAAGLDRPGRVVNRRRTRAADLDHNAPVPDEVWNTALRQHAVPAWDAPDAEDPDEPDAAPGAGWTPPDPPGPDPAPDAAAGWHAESSFGPDPALDAGGHAESSPVPDADWPAESPDAPAAGDPWPENSRELSPERLAKAAAADAAWRAFADGEREAGTEIRTNRRARSRWLTTFSGERPAGTEAAADPAPKRRTVLRPVLLRCLLYLGPLSVAVAAAGALGRVAWPVPALTLLLGWSAAQALTSVGVTVARRAGPAEAARLVGAGFAAVTAFWCALAWTAPLSLLGPDRLLAASVGAGGLATLATVTAALVTRSEAAVVRWYLPCWLLAAAALAASGGAGWARYVPVETMLPAVIVTVLIRAFRPAVLTGRDCRIPRLTAAERRRGGAYLIIGISQAICVALLWQAGPDVTPAPAALPLLIAVPMLEALIGWHTARIDAGLHSAQTVAELGRHLRGVTWITLAGLLPPLAAGLALALAAYRPPGLASLGGTQSAALALATGTLLGGVFAVTFLLAARSRTGIAATLAAAPPLATLLLPVLPQPAAGPLPLAVAVLAATHVAGLLIVALTAADLRRTS
ncbi:hypothetical protein [Actinoplanes siamensis]|uniref:Uncharacterized protein n=1 Tax=Actinoplanes siamensis TaxID=1223317 RepID=A0A919K8I6_9ACTN|nr:hypothetical protein [Actinoplanes siamensis]GIF02961.1 hypothetical protein Asi03nite_04990 [Actinoplanes siamensis]